MQSCMLILVCNNFRGQHAVELTAPQSSATAISSGPEIDRTIGSSCSLATSVFKASSTSAASLPSCTPGAYNIYIYYIIILSFNVFTFFYLHYISLPCFQEVWLLWQRESARHLCSDDLGDVHWCKDQCAAKGWVQLHLWHLDLPLILYLSRSLVNGAKSIREDHGPRNWAMDLQWWQYSFLTGPKPDLIWRCLLGWPVVLAKRETNEKWKWIIRYPQWSENPTSQLWNCTHNDFKQDMGLSED